MFDIDENIHDLLECALKIKTLGFTRLVSINYDSDTNTLVYIFTNNKKSFVKYSLETKELNESLSSIYKIATFFEDKLAHLNKLKFKKKESIEYTHNYFFSYEHINIDCLVLDGVVSNSCVDVKLNYESLRYISIDGLLESLSDLELNNYTYQVMALKAFEGDLIVSKESESSRVVLIELDRLKYKFSLLDRFIELSNAKKIDLSIKMESFLDQNLCKKNILSRDQNLFAIDFKENFKLFKLEVLDIINSLDQVYLNSFLNKLQLKNRPHPLAISTKGTSGSLLRSSGTNDNYNYINDVLFYREFSAFSPSLDSDNSLYSFYVQIINESKDSIRIIDTILDSDTLIYDAYDDFSIYDLNRFNSDSCYELEAAQGVSSIYLFKDSQNKIGYQLNTESLKRLYYYLENIERIKIEDQREVLEALDIKLQEIF